MIKIIILFFNMSFMVAAHAFPCFITVIKDNCWTDYNVTVNVLDASNENNNLVTVIVPEGSSWARQKFTCQPSQKLKFQAQFTPVFWESDEGKSYDGQHYWTLPQQITKDETAWSLTICYPEQFSEVPLPPTAGGQCKCSTAGIPPVPPQ
ncbi:hypothetical protein [Legionella oakridgensis]|uniref:Periplasmic protein n=2 Tax=Legionella oakridgensis TaxID=29423 RepID=W0BC70_9GAMM|nr:hypothetical protein [Legionella oakridgensis]AHE67450.1 hypothetical protein Loa_01903 [Legionella oakridgensis ATCC 33761 = DSM 21215]ETO92979.1 hypothetical protein LOR_44c07060 [Legionella oakridgensis RV-2-2007]KTD43507.1 periplasmic protein [Legionella oakridgensis]STY20499.1 periplasmic protein [Legionella longbeachae]